jgi:hypothetical protein
MLLNIVKVCYIMQKHFKISFFHEEDKLKLPILNLCNLHACAN